jgi:hypothetical protein
MRSLYDIYKKHHKKIKYALYVNIDKHNEIFDFLKKNINNPNHQNDQNHNYLITLISKNKNIIKQGKFINYDSGILVLKNEKDQTLYEYVKNYHLFIENLDNLNKEDQTEKYAPIIIDIDVKEEKRNKKLKEKYKKGSSIRQTLETLLEDIDEENSEKE